MSETKATLEKVREAIASIQQLGERPSAAKIMQLIGGGSKSTVLKHMHTVFEDLAVGRPAQDTPKLFLTALAEPLVAKLLDEARRLCNQEHAGRMKRMLDLQSSLFDEVAVAVAAEEAATERATAAEIQLAKLQQEVGQRIAIEEQVAQLAHVVRALKGDRPSEPPMLALIGIVASTDAAMGREEVYKRMLQLGFAKEQAIKARAHAVEGGYLNDTGAATKLLSITDAGRERLTAGGGARTAA